jgi:uncharacterized protein (DUF1697 family)
MARLTTYVALLRGINVGGNRPVAMAALRDLLTSSGFVEAKTLLQSGNVVFRSELRSAAEVERTLAAVAADRLGLETEFFVRTAAEWAAVVESNPLRKDAERDPRHFLVVFLKDTPEAANVKALQTAITGPEILRAKGRELYVAFPQGLGNTRLSGAVMERKLGMRATGRNWNTVRKLHALSGA